MQNNKECSNCKTENPFYVLTCSGCGSYMRERVYNIDLWKIIWTLIEAPFTGMKNIVFAEHKNFIIPLLLLACFQQFLKPLVEIIPVSESIGFVQYFSSAIAGAAAFTIIVLLFWAVLLLFQKVRFKDLYGVLIYAQFPFLISLFFLFPVQFALFGENMFSFDPSPFFLKPSSAYILGGLNVLVIIWCLSLTFAAVFTITRSKILAILASIIFQAFFFFLPYFMFRIL